MDLPKYEDVHPAYTASGYVATNEEPRIHSMLLAPHRHIERAASIASGGEIPLMVLLARCKEVVAVDHSYFALASTMLKAILLQTLGARKLVEMMVEQSYNDFKPHMENAKNYMPPTLAANASFTDYHYRDIRNEWFYVKVGVMERVRQRLCNLTLIHGDITDLASHGVFDCLYLSNALEHINRNSVAPKMDAIAPLIKDNGLLIVTHTIGYKPSFETDPTFSSKWDKVRAITGTRSGWDHRLLRKRGTVVAPSPLMVSA